MTSGNWLVNGKLRTALVSFEEPFAHQVGKNGHPQANLSQRQTWLSFVSLP